MAANKINSRSKGSRFERSIAKWLTDWTGYEFGRVPGSGSLRWKKTDNITGDITCTDPKHARRFPFTVECKSYQEIKFEHILLGLKTCKIASFWEQALGDAKRANKVPILIMKYNSMPKGESFFVVTKQVGQFILDNAGERHLRCMAIDSEKYTLHVFMASEIKKTDYTTIYKYARSLVKTK